MNLAFLKSIRVAVSLIFFISIGFLFIDIKETVSEAVSDSVLYLQFIPSLLSFIGAGIAFSFGWLIILIITVACGRIYCSSICPLGTLQDVIIYIKGKLLGKKERKKMFRYSKPLNFLRYGLLAITSVCWIFGMTYFLLILDPYSNFGRLLTNFIRPIIVATNNGLVGISEKLNFSFIYPFEGRDIPFYSILFPLAILILVTWLSVKYGRLYCNSACPVGTLLALVSRFSIFKISIDPSACNHCRKCSYNCKAGCIDYKNQVVDFDRCIACFNCFKVCDRNAFYFSNLLGAKREALTTETEGNLMASDRRSFFSGLIGLFFVLSGFQLKAKRDSVFLARKTDDVRPTEIPEKREHPVFPPGAERIDHFNDCCTACTLCVSACPNHVLQPALWEYGLIGFMQPRMDYSSGYCNYECKICSEVCPTGAILPIETLEVKKTIQLGKAKFIKENCVVYTDGTDCGACSEHCPTKAVNMVPYNDTGLFIPEIDDTICVGCGACEYPCPTRPYKAIFVDGNPEHLVADPQKTEELEIKKPEEDFPF